MVSNVNVLNMTVKLNQRRFSRDGQHNRIVFRQRNRLLLFFPCLISTSQIAAENYRSLRYYGRYELILPATSLTLSFFFYCFISAFTPMSEDYIRPPFLCSSFFFFFILLSI